MPSAEDTELIASGESARVREVIEALDQIVFLIAIDLSRVFYVSSSFERISGLSRDVLYENPRAWIEAVHEEDRDAVLDANRKRQAGELSGRFELEFRLRSQIGPIRWVRTVISPVNDESGRPTRLAGFVEDITPRKEAEVSLKKSQEELAREVDARAQELSRTVTRLEQEIEQRKQIERDLRRSEARFRRLFEANIIGVIFSDVYGNISEANATFLEMLGYTRDDMPLRWDTMTPPEWTHFSELAVQQLVRGEVVPPWEKEYLHKDGRRVPVLIGVALLDRESGECISFVIDLTKAKNAEEQLRQVNMQLEHASRLSVMGEMLADLAHEIHQPLGVITNYANGTLRRLKKGELTVGALKDRLREIAAESIRVADVLRRIREFIRRREPDRTSVDLNAIVMDALQLTRLERREHAVAVIVRPDRDLPPVQADRVQITQVLVNLILNAIHATAAGKRDNRKILISTYINDGGLTELVVADNGPGISAADLPHIFERFFTTKSGGLGLGLAISRSIIESHAGQLRCDSAAGEPAIFRLMLPPHKTLIGAH
jgi:PAS domain S-box-containing protein